MYDDYLLGNLDLSPVPSDCVSGVVDSPYVIFANWPGLSYYGMKVDLPPFDDVRGRGALHYVVERQDIVDSVVHGYVTVAEGLAPPGMQGYNKHKEKQSCARMRSCPLVLSCLP